METMIMFLEGFIKLVVLLTTSGVSIWFLHCVYTHMRKWDENGEGRPWLWALTLLVGGAGAGAYHAGVSQHRVENQVFGAGILVVALVMESGLLHRPVKAVWRSCTRTVKRLRGCPADAVGAGTPVDRFTVEVDAALREFAQGIRGRVPAQGEGVASIGYRDNAASPLGRALSRIKQAAGLVKEAGNDAEEAKAADEEADNDVAEADAAEEADDAVDEATTTRARKLTTTRARKWTRTRARTKATRTGAGTALDRFNR